MFRRFAVIAAVASCFAAAGFAQSPPPASVAPAATQAAKKPAPKAGSPKAKSAGAAAAAASGPCQVGVVAVSGGKFGIQRVGFTVFGNAYTAVPVESWGLDDLIVARVRVALPRAAVRKISYTKEDVARVEQSRSLFRSAREGFKDFIQSTAPNTSCERYVLVTRDGSRFSNTNQTVAGVGIVQWGNPIKERTYLFALTYIRVFDGQTFELLKHGAASTDEGLTLSRVLLIDPVRGPNRELDGSAFPANASEAAASPTLREGVRSLLTASLDKTLPAMLGR